MDAPCSKCDAKCCKASIGYGVILTKEEGESDLFKSYAKRSGGSYILP